jgi:hypothetical protein
VTCYFNGAGWRSRLLNYRSFRRHLQAPLLCVELAFDDRPFELEHGDADILVQLRGGDVMWQKERLLNLAVRHLPDSCDYVAWLDCDMVFKDGDWQRKALDALQDNAVVQLYDQFSEVLPQGGEARRFKRSAVSALRDPLLFDRLFRSAGISEELGCLPGLAWAASRPLMASLGLYDRLIMGSGDKAFLCAVYGRGAAFLEAYGLSPVLWADFVEWSERMAAAVDRRIGFIDSRVEHLAHGEIALKRYGNRYGKLLDFDFRPEEDIGLSGCGAWQWTTDKVEMHRYVLDYFFSRREDDPMTLAPAEPGRTLPSVPAEPMEGV